MVVNTAYELKTLPPEIFRVRCEVRDGGGNSSQAVRSIERPKYFPHPPDVIADLLLVQLAGFGELKDLDTLVVGDSVFVTMHRTCWVESPGQVVWNHVFVDDILLWSAGWACEFGQGCGLFHVGWTFDTPGIHEFRFDVDVRDDIAEADETNNSYSREVVVLSADP
jgi:hypothetical protein